MYFQIRIVDNFGSWTETIIAVIVKARMTKITLFKFFILGGLLGSQVLFSSFSASTPKTLFLQENREMVQDLSSPGVIEPSQFERQKILYLLKRVESSPLTFIRNGKYYTGPQAARHFRWKYRRGMGRIPTAEQFIESIASRSMASGKLYLVKNSDGKAYPLKDILRNELSRVQMEVQRGL